MTVIDGILHLQCSSCLSFVTHKEIAYHHFMGDVVNSPEQVICIDCLNRELNKVEAENQRLKKQIAEKK